MRFQKSRVTPIDLKTIHEFFTSLKQTFPDNSDRQIFFLVVCSLLFVSPDNPYYNILYKLRPYGGLIGIDNSSMVKYSRNSKVLTIARNFARRSRIYTRVLPRGSHVLVHVALELQQQLIGTF